MSGEAFVSILQCSSSSVTGTLLFGLNKLSDIFSGLFTLCGREKRGREGLKEGRKGEKEMEREGREEGGLWGFI